jgi:hypothetical protein
MKKLILLLGICSFSALAQNREKATVLQLFEMLPPGTYTGVTVHHERCELKVRELDWGAGGRHAFTALIFPLKIVDGHQVNFYLAHADAGSKLQQVTNRGRTFMVTARSGDAFGHNHSIAIETISSRERLVTIESKRRLAFSKVGSQSCKIDLSTRQIE